MIIFPITRGRFLEETRNTTLIPIQLPVIDDYDKVPGFMKQRWSRYFEIPGVGVFWYIRSFNKLLASQSIDLKELLSPKTTVSIEHWAIELLDKEQKFPYNFYYRLSGTGTEVRHSLNGNYKMQYDENAEDTLLKCIHSFYEDETTKEQPNLRWVQFNLRDTIHGDTIFCSIQEETEWSDTAQLLVGSEIQIPVNVMECLSDRYLALSIISLKYDG